MNPLFLAILAAWAFAPGVASAEPVSAAIVAFLGFTGTAAAVATFVINTALAIAATALATKLTTPKRGAAAGQERQASVLNIQLGETDREAVLGEVATGGAMLDAFNHGGTYGTDWEVYAIKLADHRCHSLVGFYIGDTWYPFAADGVQAGFNNQLEVYWHAGTLAQAADAYLLANSGGAWTALDRMAGCAYVVVAFKADAPNAANPIWSTGRPGFLWRVKGAYLYDPREDSTVAGGSGAHRWDDPATWEWSDNAYLGRYAYTRGIYAGDQVDAPEQLLIGRGLSALEAPPERVIAHANLCDEAVTLKAGGTQPRYRIGAVVRAGERFIAVEEMFAATMAGVIVQREGSVEIEPGAAKSVVRTITDADLAVGHGVKFMPFASENERVNTVTPRFVDPEQIWRDTAAPVRRSVADIIDDGGPKDDPLSLSFVNWHQQAQRCGEIRRRLARKERRAAIVLVPIHCDLEEGDWIAWQSDRYLLGATVNFRIEAHSEDRALNVGLVLREISTTCFGWVAATDEGTPGQAPVEEPGSLDPLELTGVDIETFQYVGAGGQEIPGVIAIWDTPLDPAILGVRLEIRVDGSTEVSATLAEDPAAGAMTTTNGVAPGVDLEGRLVPIGSDGRRVTPSAWIAVLPGDMAAKYLLGAGGALLTYADITGALNSVPSKNLFRKADWLPFDTAALVDPMTIGDALWGFTLPGNSTARIEGGAGKTYAPTIDDLLARYSVSFKAKVSVGTGVLRGEWRDAAGVAIADMAQDTFNLTTTATRFKVDNFQSALAAFRTAKYVLFLTAPDVAAGRTVSITDLQMEFGSQATTGWRPSPDDVDLLRYAGYLGSLLATRNTIYRQSGAPGAPTNGDIWIDTTTAGSEIFKVYSDVTATWYVSSTVGGAFGTNLYHTPGGTLATLSAFLTSSGTAAAFTGQAAWATHTAKTPTGSLQYLGEDGKISNVQGLGAVTSGFGQALVLDHFPMTADDTHIYIDSFTVKGFPSYSRAISGYTFSSMPPGNSWHILLYWPTGGFGLADNSDLNGYLATGDWLFLGTMATSSSAVFPPPPASPPGYYGGGAGDPYVFQP